jgi:hypothetical protein
MSLSIVAPSKKGHWKGQGYILRYQHSPRTKSKAVTTGLTDIELKTILNKWDYKPCETHTNPTNTSLYNDYLESCITKHENIEDYQLYYLDTDGIWSKYVLYNIITQKYILRSSCRNIDTEINGKNVGTLVKSHDTNWWVNPTNIWTNAQFWNNLKLLINS